VCAASVTRPARCRTHGPLQNYFCLFYFFLQACAVGFTRVAPRELQLGRRGSPTAVTGATGPRTTAPSSQALSELHQRAPSAFVKQAGFWECSLPVEQKMSSRQRAALEKSDCPLRNLNGSHCELTFWVFFKAVFYSLRAGGHFLKHTEARKWGLWLRTLQTSACSPLRGGKHLPLHCCQCGSGAFQEKPLLSEGIG